MLVLSRVPGQSLEIHVPGWPPIRVEVVARYGEKVRLGVDAAKEISIVRTELIDVRAK